MTNLEKALVLVEQASWITASEGALNPSWLAINNASDVVKREIAKEASSAINIPPTSPK